jgi:PEP-CTERM motif
MVTSLVRCALSRGTGIPFAVIALLGGMSSAFGATTYGTAASVVSGTTGVFASSSFAGIVRQVANTGDNLTGGTLYDRVASSDTTTWSFNSMLSSFGGLLDLRLGSNGLVGSGANSESVLVSFVNSSTGTVGSACAYGDFAPNPSVLGCQATKTTSYQTYLNFKATNPTQYFDRVVFSYGDKYTGESYTFGAAKLTAVTAVPEPETYALMLAGLGAIGFMSRRRKSR